MALPRSPAVVFVPAPPVLVPAVARGAAGELDDLRAAIRDAITAATASARRVVLVGAGPQSRVHAAGARGTLAGFGEPVEAGGTGPLTLPTTLTVGAWLLADAGVEEARAVEIGTGPAPDLPAADALIVLGEGSARRSTAAPGYLDERAEAYDDAVASALRSGDPDALAALDPRLGAELLAQGAQVWAAVAAALRGGRWDAELTYAAAPYGVGYFVARWRPA